MAKFAPPPGMRVSALLLECEEVLAGADLRDLAQAAAKLGEVERQLAALLGDSRAGRAHVKEQIRRIKLASLDAV